MKERLKLAFCWACFQIILWTPVNVNSRLYCWLLSWAGWYAYRNEAAADQEQAQQAGER